MYNRLLLRDGLRTTIKHCILLPNGLANIYTPNEHYFLADDKIFALHLSAVYKTRRELVWWVGGEGRDEIMATVICRRSGLAPELTVNLGILAEVWMIDTLIRRPTTSGASDVPSKCPIH